MIILQKQHASLQSQYAALAVYHVCSIALTIHMSHTLLYMLYIYTVHPTTCMMRLRVSKFTIATYE